MGISTHVLDTTRGRPAAGMEVELERLEAGSWAMLAGGRTDADGRLAALLPRDEPPAKGVYRLRFATGAYFAATGAAGFFPLVEICFAVGDADVHCHVPLLLTANSYTTYRGS